MSGELRRDPASDQVEPFDVCQFCRKCDLDLPTELCVTAFLEALQLTYLADLPAIHLDLRPKTATPVVELPPALQPAPERRP